MTSYSLKNYLEKLDHQVIHMDQGLSYNPEFNVTHKMSDYPSRKMQLARAVFYNQILPSDYISDILFNSILSRQGERWQCFSENPEDYTDLMILSREMMKDKGFGCSGEKKFDKKLSKNKIGLFEQNEETDSLWRKSIEVNEKSNCMVLISEPTWNYCSKQAENLSVVLKKCDIETAVLEPVFLGWEYFILGNVSEGIKHLEQLIKSFKEKGIQKIVTTCGMGEYIFKTFCKKLNLAIDIEVVSLIDLINDSISHSNTSHDLFLFAGSFYTRYLDKSNQINQLIPNTSGKRVLSTEENLRIYKSPSQRINDVTIWHKPLCPEFVPFDTVSPNILAEIYSKGITDFKISQAKTMVFFEPYSFDAVRIQNPEISITYYWKLFI